MRRSQHFAKSPPYFWLALHWIKVRWRFRKMLWPSKNIWTLHRIMTSVAEFCVISQIHIEFFGWMSSSKSKTSLSKSNARLKISTQLVMFSITETSEMGVKKQNPFLPKTLFWYVHPPSELMSATLELLYYYKVHKNRYFTSFVETVYCPWSAAYNTWLFINLKSWFLICKQVTEYVHCFKQNSFSK